MINNRLIKHIEKYERLSNELFALKSAGEIRASKGELCVNMCCSLLKDIIGDNPSFEIHKKYKIKTELETTEVDVCVTKNGTPFCILECKAYCDFSMFKRFALEVVGIQEKYPNAKFYVFELENSSSTTKINKLCSMLGINVDKLTYLNGRRNSSRPIHQREFYKSPTEYSVYTILRHFQDVFKMNGNKYKELYTCDGFVPDPLEEIEKILNDDV